MTGEEARATGFYAALRRDAHVSRRARQPVGRARLAHAISRARRRGEPPAGDDRRRAGQRDRRRRIQFRRHSARRHPAHRTAARAAVRPLRRQRAFRRAHHRHQIRTRPSKPEFNARVEGGTQRSAEGSAIGARLGRPVLRLHHDELCDHQRLQHRARRLRARRRQALRRDRQGRHRLLAELQRRGLRAPPPPQGRIRPAGSVLRQHRAGGGRARLLHQLRRDARRASKARSSCSTSAGSSR